MTTSVYGLSSIACPAVCRPVYYISFTWTQIVLLLSLIVLRVHVKGQISTRAYRLATILVIVAFLISFHIDFIHCASGCTKEGFRILKTLKVLPTWDLS